jgi:hypothetical protein
VRCAAWIRTAPRGQFVAAGVSRFTIAAGTPAEIAQALQASDTVEFGNLLFDAIQAILVALHAQLVDPGIRSRYRIRAFARVVSAHASSTGIWHRSGHTARAARPAAEGEAFADSSYSQLFELTLRAAPQGLAVTTRRSRNRERKGVRSRLEGQGVTGQSDDDRTTRPSAVQSGALNEGALLLPGSSAPHGVFEQVTGNAELKGDEVYGDGRHITRRLREHAVQHDGDDELGVHGEPFQHSEVGRG